MRNLLPWPPQAARHEAQSHCLKAARGEREQGTGARGSLGPMSWGGVSSQPCSLQGSSRAEREVSISSLGSYTLSLLLSAVLFGRRSCGTTADNGCSRLQADRHLMLLTPQPPILFIFFCLSQPAEVLPAARSTRIPAPIAGLHVPGDPTLLGCPPVAKGLLAGGKQCAEQTGCSGDPSAFPPLQGAKCKCILTRWTCGREASPPWELSCPSTLCQSLGCRFNRARSSLRFGSHHLGVSSHFLELCLCWFWVEGQLSPSAAQFVQLFL